jgi:hypothetical protein
MQKTRSEGPNRDYRFGGLAEKICKTHPIVLMKRQNIRVRSTKALGLDLVAKIWKYLGVTQDIYPR